MGISCVFLYQGDGSGKTNQQSEEELRKRLEALGSQRLGAFTLDCEPYCSNPTSPTPNRTIQLLHSSDFPLSSFALVDTGTVLTAERTLDSLLVKLKPFYSIRKNQRIDVKGHKYELGDFIVKVGSVFFGASCRGIVIEVIYEPCNILSEGGSLIQEFIQEILPSHPQVASPPTNGSEVFEAHDAISQYVQAFASLRSAHPLTPTGGGQPSAAVSR